MSEDRPSASSPAGNKPDWLDEGSRRAEEFLSTRGLALPWRLGEKLDEDHTIFGLRSGGSGVVYLVESSRFGEKRTFAAKTHQGFLSEEFFGLPTHKQQKTADAFLEGALPWFEMGQHPHIVPVSLVMRVVHPRKKCTVPFILSRYMEKGSLAGLLRNRRFSTEEAIVLGIHLCDGLLHAYRHGIVAHRNLKPDNIMVEGPGWYRVTDLSSGGAGTLGYMAPEQVAWFWRAQGEEITGEELPVDLRADQFAIGVILLEALLGDFGVPDIIKEALPWGRKGEVPSDLWERGAQQRAREFAEGGIGPLPNGLGSLHSLISRLLAPLPGDRFGTITELRGELLRKLGGTYTTPADKTDDSPQWWFYRGQSFLELDRPAAAEEPYQDALRRFCAIPGTEIHQATCLMQLGLFYGRSGRFNEARENFTQALAIFRMIPGNEIDQAGCLVNLGNVFGCTGLFDKELEHHTQALAIYRAIPGTEIEQAACLLNVGILHYNTGKTEDATKYAMEALSICEQNPEGTEEIRIKCLKIIRKSRDLNLKYQRDLAAWKSLPLWKRIRTTKPEPPRGI